MAFEAQGKSMSKKERDKRYRESHREEQKIWKHQWYLRNRDRILELRKQYKKDRPEKVRLNDSCCYYKKNNKPEYKLRRKRYNILNRQRISERGKKYYKENNIYEKFRDRYRANNITRRALEKASGRLKIKDIQRLYEDNIKEFGTLTCYLCLKPIEFGQDSIDHRTPLSRGGTNAYNNLGVTHLKCNLIKGKKTLDEFREYKQLEMNV